MNNDATYKSMPQCFAELGQTMPRFTRADLQTKLYRMSKDKSEIEVTVIWGLLECYFEQLYNPQVSVWAKEGF